MKVSEILRVLADIVDAGSHADMPLPNAATLSPVSAHVAAEPEEITEPGDHREEKPLMMSPLQQKIELLKKSVGVGSAFDEEGDELSRMKKMAGIATIHVVDEDEPFEG